jgi:hypothetical protein
MDPYGEKQMQNPNSEYEIVESIEGKTGSNRTLNEIFKEGAGIQITCNRVTREAFAMGWPYKKNEGY